MNVLDLVKKMNFYSLPTGKLYKKKEKKEDFTGI